MTKKKRRLQLRVVAFVMSTCLFVNNSIFVLAAIIAPEQDNYVLTEPVQVVEIQIKSLSYEVVTIEPEVKNIPPESPEIIPTPTILPEVEIIPEFSDEDIALIARVTMSESSTQSFDVQVAVAQTVINRVHSGNFGDTVSDVVYADGQYSTADNGEPSTQIYDAVNEAITNMPYPYDMYYFRQWHYHKWAKDYKQLGDLYFSLES